MSSINYILTRPVVRLSMLAAVLVFAYPPFPFGFLAWVIPALVLAVLDGRSVRDSFRYGWWFGFCMHLGLVYWTAPVTVPGTLALAIILGLYVAVVFAAYAFLRRAFGSRAIWLWPIVFTGSWCAGFSMDEFLLHPNRLHAPYSVCVDYRRSGNQPLGGFPQCHTLPAVEKSGPAANQVRFD
jgi:apolipoprotein N-acyltransferase